MEVSNYLRKLETILMRMFERKIVINEYHAEKMLKFLEDRSVNSPGMLILNAPRFSDIVLHYLEKINDASCSFKVFLLEIVAILLKYNTNSNKLRAMQSLAFKVCIDNVNPATPPTLHLACIKFATSQLTHSSGLDLTVEHKLWKNILYENIHHQRKQISNAAYTFITKLVWKLDEHNLEPALLEVLGHILEPIKSIGYLDMPVLDAEKDAAFCEKIFSHLSALLAVMYEPITTVISSKSISKVMCLLKEHFLLDHTLYAIFIATKNTCLSKLLSPCFFLYCFQLHQHLLHNNKTDEFCNKMAAYHRNYTVLAVKKRDAFTIIDYVIVSNMILSNFKKLYAPEFNSPFTFERNGNKIEFSLQIVIHLLVPTLKYASFERIKELKTDLMELFITKMGKTITDYIYSSCALYGTLLDEGGDTLKVKVATHTLKEMMRLREHLSGSQAGCLFQSLYYLLDKFILCDGAGGMVVTEKPMELHDLRILSLLLDAMKMLLKKHNIPWYENIEIVNIQADLLNLLKQRFLTTKLVVQVLDLINICIKKFLSPNMSLLMENTSKQDSTLNAIGAVMKLYMLYEDWEVRDSALNLLSNCTEISFIKYIPLQRLIEENGLMKIAAKAALTDPEFYSQCTALKCLTAASKIDSLWQEVLEDNEYIHLHLVCILRSHSEGMVRKEAVNVLTGMYANQKVATNFQNSLYEIMQIAAIDDLHWEVQLAALNFWKIAIHEHLKNRGMLDGKFPSVTFSKEKRKIITLNDAEIQRQLSGAMNHLSNIGCLTVLLECMNDIHGIEVMDQAYGIVKELTELLDKYNFQKLIQNVEPKLLETLEIPSSYLGKKYFKQVESRPISEEESDKIIENILETDQSDLIMQLHDSFSQMKSEEMDIDVGYCPQRSYVQPDKFLENVRNNDYFSIIKSKSNCTADGLNTLDRLLDDILYLEIVT